MPEQNLLGGLNEGFKLIMANFQWERLAMALGAVGAMQIAWERTASVRARAPGLRPPALGHQAIRHKLADLATSVYTCRCVTYDALRRFIAGEEPLREVTMAKLLTQRACFELMDACLQIHGGAGYMREYWVERAARDSRLGPIGGGSDEIMREILGRVLGLCPLPLCVRSDQLWGVSISKVVQPARNRSARALGPDIREIVAHPRLVISLCALCLCCCVGISSAYGSSAASQGSRQVRPPQAQGARSQSVRQARQAPAAVTPPTSTANTRLASSAARSAAPGASPGRHAQTLSGASHGRQRHKRLLRRPPPAAHRRPALHRHHKRPHPA